MKVTHTTPITTPNGIHPILPLTGGFSTGYVFIALRHYKTHAQDVAALARSTLLIFHQLLRVSWQACIRHVFVLWPSSYDKKQKKK